LGTIDPKRWYADVTRYQWLVLVVASAGWVFDAFEGQLFNITRDSMLSELIGAGPEFAADRRWWGDVFLAVFLLGGTLGGVLFGSLADRFGRKPTLAVTILFYSIFSGLTFFATELWHVAVLRFLVAVGVGGEWAVAAALVAEVFPAAARPRASGIFHATSVLGVWLAALVGLGVTVTGAGWRVAFVVGVAPALLVLWVRTTVREPERWERTAAAGGRRGSLRELFGDRRWARSAILGVLLAAVGLGTYWGVTVAGQDLAKDLLVRSGASADQASGWAIFAYGFVQTVGALAGMLCFGPLAERLGRRGAFALLHALALVVVPATCYLPQTYGQLLAALTVYGFVTVGIHAGYAVYFPELFPDHLRSTGAGVCFNGGRLLAAPILLVSGGLKAQLGLHEAVSLLAGLFLLGLVVIWFLPETKGKPLPE
jgi:MFS family permease